MSDFVQLHGFTVVTSHPLALACKLAGKWGVYLSHRGDQPLLHVHDLVGPTKLPAPLCVHLFAHDTLALLFDTRDEMQSCFDRITGDAGPTKANDYSGPLSVYAATCSPTGEMLDENT